MNKLYKILYTLNFVTAAAENNFKKRKENTSKILR
jgi:hypothetical protein